MDSKTLKQIYKAQTLTAKRYYENMAYVRGKNPTIFRNCTGDDPDNRLPIPLGKVAVDNMTGYMMPPGEPDVYYQLIDATEEWSGKDDEYNQIIKEWRDLNDDQLHIGEVVNEALANGVCYEVLWASASDNNSFPLSLEWALVSAKDIYIHWTNSLKPVMEYAIRFYQTDKPCAVVYFPEYAEGWKLDKNGWARNEDDDMVYPFAKPPVIEARINRERMPVFEAEKQMIDQLDKVMSKSLNEVDRFNALIALFPFLVDADIAADLKNKGYFHGLDNFDSEKWPRFLEKNLSGAIELYKWLAESLERLFHKTSRIIDFTDPTFGSGDESGVAKAMKLLCMEMVAAKAEIYLRRWLTERKDFYDACITEGNSGLDVGRYKAEIKWGRNVPVSSKEQLEIATMMYGLGISREAILKILPKAILPNWEAELEGQNLVEAPNVPPVVE